MTVKELYLDDAATSRVWAEVVRAMGEVYSKDYGNPSSLHTKGEKAMELLHKAREELARVIGAKPWEIYFTSGGTESDNLALIGLARKMKGKERKILVSAIEHAAVMEACEFLKDKGVKIEKIPVDREGKINLQKLEKMIDKNTILVSVIHANNIVGTVQDLEDIGEVCKRKGVLFHTDAVQSFGKLKIDVDRMGIAMLSASAHKLGGPKGIGLLYVRQGVKLAPMIFGGGQEKGLRSGTENVAGAVGFAKASEVYRKKVDKSKMRKIRDELIVGLEGIGGKINGAKDERLYNNVHVSFKGIDSDSLVIYLSERGIYVSAGSACDSKKNKEDHVLKALGLKEREMRGSIRITISSDMGEKDVNRIVREINKALNTLRV